MPHYGPRQFVLMGDLLGLTFGPMPSTFCRRNPEFQDTQPAHLHRAGPVCRKWLLSSQVVSVGCSQTSTISMSESGGRMIQLPRYMAPRAREHAISLPGAALRAGITAAGGLHLMKIVHALHPIVTNGRLPDYKAPRCGYEKELSLTRVGCVGIRARHGRSRRNGEIRLANGLHLRRILVCKASAMIKQCCHLIAALSELLSFHLSFKSVYYVLPQSFGSIHSWQLREWQHFLKRH